MSVGVLVPDGATARSGAAAAGADESADPEAKGPEPFALTLEANVAQNGAHHGPSRAAAPKKIADAHAPALPLIAQAIPPPPLLAKALVTPGLAQGIAAGGQSRCEPAIAAAPGSSDGEAQVAGADLGIPAVAPLAREAGDASVVAPGAPSASSPSRGAGHREPPRIEAAAAAGQTHTVATMASTESTGDPAKTLTAVKPPSPGAMTIADAGRGRLRDATASVANQGVLRRGVVGEIELPELGRVVVRAETRGGSVDVRIESDRADTHVALYGAAPEVAADLRTADVNLGQLQFQLANVASTAVDGAGVARGTPPRERAKSSSEPAEEGPSGGRPRRRVRIVL